MTLANHPLEHPAAAADLRDHAGHVFGGHLIGHLLDPLLTRSGRIARVRYSLPRHKAANWVGPGRGRKTTRPGANDIVELSQFEFLDRLADPVIRSSHLRFHLREARPPIGPSSSRNTFDRDVFQASLDELPVIDIHSL